MIRIFSVFLMVFMVLGLGLAASDPAGAQNIFVTPDSKKNSKSRESESRLPGIVVSPEKSSRSRNIKRDGRAKKQQVFKKKPRSLSADFDIFKQVKGLDPSIMGPAGPKPRTQEELRLVAAGHMMPQVTSMLEERRKSRQEYARQRALEQRKNARRDHLRSVAAKGKKKLKPVYKPEAEDSGKPRRIFNSFR